MNSFEGKILLTIDDEDSLRRSIRLFFEDSGFVVLEAANGRLGIEMVHSHHPDIVLVDLRMPEMDGLEVISILSKEEPDLPIIVVSGTGILDDAIEAIRAGASDYITKPVTDMLALQHTVEKTLEKGELIRQNRMYQHHLEQLVEERTSELRQAQKMEAMGTLAGGIAHDFNNILSGILGYNELAQLSCADSKHLGYLKEVEKAGYRAKDLIQQILTFSRKQETSTHPIQIAPILKEALKLLRSSLPASIVIKQSIISGALVLADPSQIHQIIMNLCTNSFQAMEKEGGVLEVSLQELDLPDPENCPESTLPRGNYLSLTVSDNGLGMTAQTVERIFEPYYTTKETGQGTGLGLAVVHGIVGSYHGEITVTSSMGEGTTFRITLPTTDNREQNPLALAPHETSLSGKERILFVDDEKMLISVAELAFSQFGYQINTFTDPLAALTEFQNNPDNYDLVITDMTMPGLSGDKLVAAIHRIRPHTPIFICSGYAEDTIREKNVILGVNRYINKPLVMTKILAEVRHLFDKPSP